MQLSRSDLAKILDIVDPFLMVDEVLELLPGRSASALCHVGLDAWYLHCHLTRDPVMPGVLQAEVMLQTFALPVLLADDNLGHQSFLREFKVTLFKKVKSNETPLILHAQAEILTYSRGIYTGRAELSVEGDIIASMNITMISPHELPVPRLGL